MLLLLSSLMGDPLSAPTHCGYFKHEEGEGHTLSREQEGRKVAGREKGILRNFLREQRKSFQPHQAAAASEEDGRNGLFSKEVRPLPLPLMEAS